MTQSATPRVFRVLSQVCGARQSALVEQSGLTHRPATQLLSGKLQTQPGGTSTPPPAPEPGAPARPVTEHSYPRQATGAGQS